MKLITADKKLNHLSVLMVAAAPVFLVLGASAQPELAVQKGSQSAKVGQRFRIECQVSWTGDAGEYAILPPEVDPIDWGSVEVLPSQAFVRDGKNFVVQTIEITPTKSGEMKTPAIVIPYLRPEDIKKPEKPDTPTHLNATDAPPKLRADPFPLLVQPHTTPAWLFGVLGALLFALLVVVWRVVKRRKSATVPPPVSQSPDLEAVRAKLQTARQYRISGDYYGFYRELTAAAALMEPHTGNLSATLKARTEEVGYRGNRPTDDQLDGDVRDVERVLGRLASSEDS